MTSTVFAVVIACIALAAYLGYVLGRKDTEETYYQAERDERLERLENSRRFADLVRQTQTIRKGE